MNPPAMITAAERVLGVAELLEIILRHLSLGEILYNAQAVAKFWRNCIQGSRAIREALLLATIIVDEADADDRLYMKPVLVDISFLHKHRERIARDIGDDRPTLANIRKYAAKDPHRNFHDYMDALVVFYKYLDEDKARFDLNAGSSDMDNRAVQLCSSAVHPFIHLGLWTQDGCCWTGYGSSAVLYICDTQYPKDFHFSTLSRIVLRMFDMVQDCPTASWIDSTVANPAFTTLTISARIPVVRSFSKIKCAQTVRLKNGVTIRDLLLLIANIAVRALQDFEHAKICGIWGGFLDGGFEHEQTRKAEMEINKIREKTQPGFIAAKELLDLLNYSNEIVSS